MVAISLLSFRFDGSPLLHDGCRSSGELIFRFSTMAISIPTGVKIFNCCLHCIKDVFVLQFQCFGHWHLFQTFVVGGVTGVMLELAAADYQYPITATS